MARNTQETYVRGIKMLFDWAEREEYTPKNPARDLKALGKEIPAKEARDPFKLEELKKLFSAPLYIGCQNDGAGYAVSGPNRPKRTRFWVPLIALFSGMRLNEICQLHVSDIKCTSKGVYYFDLNDDCGKRLKNGPSKRRVPIHPQLIKAGFLEFVGELGTSGSAKLFGDIRVSGHGYHSERMSRWFNEGFLQHLGIKTEKNSFHSFRHTFRDALRRARVPLEVADALGGWNTVRGSSTNYGNGYDVDQLHKNMQRIRYWDLDLTHLEIAIS